MKKFSLAAVLLLLSVSFFAFNKVQKYADIFERLGISNTDARDHISNNLRHGSLSIPYSKAIKSIYSGKRADAVKEIGDYIKKYVSSPEYIATYKEDREQSKPQAPEDAAAYVQRRIAELNQEISSTESEMKKASGDFKKLYEATLKMQKDQLKILSNPKDPMFALYGGKTEEMQAEELKEYKLALKEYEDDFPADPRQLIKRRLQQFLDLTSDIDFDAKLVSRYGKMRFENPILENKDSNWKMCFRAGKETITAARDYARQWLIELK